MHCSGLGLNPGIAFPGVIPEFRTRNKAQHGKVWFPPKNKNNIVNNIYTFCVQSLIQEKEIQKSHDSLLDTLIMFSANTQRVFLLAMNNFNEEKYQFKKFHFIKIDIIKILNCKFLNLGLV